MTDFRRRFEKAFETFARLVYRWRWVVFLLMLSVADLGIFAGVGVMLALFYTIILIPALLAIIPIKAKSRPQDHSRTKSFLDITR